MKAIDLPTKDFPIDHPRMPDVLRMLGCSEVVGADREASSTIAGLCYWLARDRAARDGGELVFGWMIEWVPELYISAMHHGVVRYGDRYFDPSATEVARPELTTTFVPDDRFTPDLNWPVDYETKHLALVDDADVRIAHEAYRENNKLRRRHNMIMKELRGVSWAPFKGWMVPPGFRRENWVRGEEKVKANFVRLHQARSRILKRYFPS